MSKNDWVKKDSLLTVDYSLPCTLTKVSHIPTFESLPQSHKKQKGKKNNEKVVTVSNSLIPLVKSNNVM